MANKDSKKWLDIATDIAIGGINPYGLAGKKIFEAVLGKEINPSSLFTYEESGYYDDKPTSQIENLAKKSDATACYILGKRYSEGTDILKRDKEKAQYWFDRALSRIKRLNTSVISDKVGLIEWLLENENVQKASDVANSITSNYISAKAYELLYWKTQEEKYREEAIERLKATLSEGILQSSYELSDEKSELLFDGDEKKIKEVEDKARIELFNRLAELTIDDSKQKRHYLIGALKENSVDSRKRFNKVDEYVINCFDLAYEEMQEKISEASSQGDLSSDMTDMLFSSIDYNERQFIYFAKNQKALAGCYDESIPWVFTLDKYPKEIQFPAIGHPQPNTIYIAHPAKRGLYLPLENANTELFNDKVRDFERLSQCLGATEISFRSVKGQLVSEEQSKTHNIEVGGDYKEIGGNVGYNNRRDTSRKEGHENQLEKVRRFNPSKYPYVPNDVNWLSTDSEWKSLVKQRLEGNMLHYSMRISSKRTMAVTDTRMDEVKLAFKSFIANAHVNYSQQMEYSFQHEEETEWEINVTFKPLEEFKDIKGEDNIDQHDLNTNKASVETMQADLSRYTENERKYLDNLQDFFEDDAEITPREHKMLDRIRKSLGISEERAKELEMSLSAPQLTEDEQEYLDMYNDYASKGEITEKERRRLDKFASALGIVEDRIKDIEQLSKTD